MTPSASAAAMERFVARADGLRRPTISVSDPSLPTLPDLKKLAQDRRAAGLPVIDQSAGDINDIGEPLSPDFAAWIPQARAQLVAAGCKSLRETSGDAYGFPGNYQQQYPQVLDVLAKSWGITGPYRGLQTVSGRAVLDFTLRGLLARAGDVPAPCIILDPLAWSGYQPLAADLGIQIINAPALAGGLANSAEGLSSALALARSKGMTPITVMPVLPSNPTGVGMSVDALARFIEVAAEVDLPVTIDAFYSPLAPEGHAAAVPLAALAARLPPEVLRLVGVIVGETKVTSSQNKTGSVLWLAPEGYVRTADTIIGAAMERMKTTNSYPRPQEALVAYALHTFPGGLQAAMGPRYVALDRTRAAMKASCDRLGLPLSIGGSFYGTVGLINEDGQALVRDTEGRPMTAPADVSRTLIERFGLVGAPGGMFSSAPEANQLVRLTAAVGLDDVRRLEAILEQMRDEAHRAG
ncbi:MAG: aspartate/methionine/tyrosine aminotransferase [Myxococcota bacterium]|jgi:aspartate/methionine/tyrosine aminotransferase